MEVIHARNVQEALPLAIDRLKGIGVDRDSRNGMVKMFPTPVTTVYHKPTERVMFWPERDCNPFFHLFESLWMLAGRNDTKFLMRFVKRMASYSDDGRTFNAAYGYRWREHFGHDQLLEVIEMLKADPNSRQAIVQIWDHNDLTKKTKDKACNMIAQFQINVHGELDMQVSNRSNDIVWGAYGANAVHFSYLQEFMAAAIGVPVGKYYQISNNFHAYHETLKQVEGLASEADSRIWNGTGIYDPYTLGEVEPFPLVSTPIKQWQEDLSVLLHDGPIVGLRDPFFRRVATPMWHAHNAFKDGEGIDKYDAALEILEQCKATDWRKASQEWIMRRREKFINGGAGE